MKLQPKCPDCGTGIGEPHVNNCDVERCSFCGGQRITCECEGHDPKASAWSGKWPEAKSTEDYPNVHGERLLAGSGDWEIVYRGSELRLYRVDEHGCRYGTSRFPVEELTALKACVERALQIVVSTWEPISDESRQ